MKSINSVPLSEKWRIFLLSGTTICSSYLWLCRIGANVCSECNLVATRNCSSLIAVLESYQFMSHTRFDRVSGSPIVVGDDICVAILDILFGYADVVIGNVHFLSFSQSQFRVAWDITLFCRDSFVVIWIWLLFATSFLRGLRKLDLGFYSLIILCESPLC
jgi:hypothetical protein